MAWADRSSRRDEGGDQWLKAFCQTQPLHLAGGPFGQVVDKKDVAGRLEQTDLAVQ